MGRLFADDEAKPVGGPRVAVLGYAFWQQRYGGDSAAIGRTLRVRGELFEIVGVTPRGFHGVEPEDVDLWLPLSRIPSVRPILAERHLPDARRPSQARSHHRASG